ncbi:tail fiber domain-containing protein [Nocardia sp. NBC_00565]|uniref:tail fiber domain-containing protein n=1 Tax=Nocardia sp. NBC_00565 TaxID=2975993 RepID=UPI002E8131AB|nr:tail fiber domain-containing protein [Nocardia sp. NBC_00565]WUC07629.1 tail fiber domain-containing protein [Nocardia sp. NBC_00565]
MFGFRWARRRRTSAPRIRSGLWQESEHDSVVNGYNVLAEVMKLPISTWRYEWEPADVRHLGPMAQDWRAAFGLGDSDKQIYNVDANGVALVCIQALQRQIVELRAEIDRLRSETPGTP